MFISHQYQERSTNTKIKPEKQALALLFHRFGRPVPMLRLVGYSQLCYRADPRAGVGENAEHHPIAKTDDRDGVDQAEKLARLLD